MIQRLGSGLVKFKSRLANTIERILEDKLSDNLTIKDFGTTGLFSVDDISVVRSWLTAVSQKGKGSMGAPINLNSELIFDFGGALVDIDFGGYPIYCDSFHFTLINLAIGSRLRGLNMVNRTAPWCVTRWNGDEWATDVASTMASLKQTNDDGFYQPTVNDGDIWAQLPANVQSQAIVSGFTLHNSNGVTIENPSGRHCSYVIDQCNDVSVINPQIHLGTGRTGFGTIVFKNIADAGWGYNNKVLGGTIRYGSVSGVTFMRQKGFTASGVKVYRCGESGIKTYQNEVGGRSARCYDGVIENIYAHQVLYDGVDACSDYGPQAERVDDYPLAQVGWNQLPTKHTIRNITAVDCYGVGLWFDGQGTTVDGVASRECGRDGLKSVGTLQNIMNVHVADCNKNNAASGVHQVNCSGLDTLSDIKVSVSSDAIVTQGGAVEAPNCVVSDVDVSAVSKDGMRVIRCNAAFGMKGRELALESSQDSVDMTFKCRQSQLANPVGTVRATLTYGVGGSESGDLSVMGHQGGVPVKGLKGLGLHGGTGVLGVASDAIAGGSGLTNGEVAFYEAGGVLRAVFKKADGSVVTYAM